MTNKRRVWSGGWVIAFTPSLKINGPMRNEWSAGQAIWFIATSYFILISNKQRIYQSLICTKKYLNRIQCRSRSCVDTYRIWSKSTKKRTWVKHNSRVDLFFFFFLLPRFPFPDTFCCLNGAYDDWAYENTVDNWTCLAWLQLSGKSRTSGWTIWRNRRHHYVDGYAEKPADCLSWLKAATKTPKEYTSMETTLVCARG